MSDCVRSGRRPVHGVRVLGFEAAMANDERSPPLLLFNRHRRDPDILGGISSIRGKKRVDPWEGSPRSIGRIASIAGKDRPDPWEEPASSPGGIGPIHTTKFLVESSSESGSCKGNAKCPSQGIVKTNRNAKHKRENPTYNVDIVRTRAMSIRSSYSRRDKTIK
jgi:hypothetical protein